MNDEIAFPITVFLSLLLGAIIGVLMTVHASPLTAELEQLKQENSELKAIK